MERHLSGLGISVTHPKTDDFAFLSLDLDRRSPLNIPKAFRRMEGAICSVFSSKILFTELWKRLVK